MNTQLPSRITIRTTLANGAIEQVSVPKSHFASTWRSAVAAAPKGAKVEAVVREQYI